MADAPVTMVVGTLVAVDDGPPRVAVSGTVIEATWVGPYIGAVGDSVLVLMQSGRAYVPGHLHTAPRPLTGTVTAVGALTSDDASPDAMDGYLVVETPTGVVRCRYVGEAPTVGTVVRLAWDASTPWVWPAGSAAEVTPPTDPDVPATPPPPPAPPVVTRGTLEVRAIESSTWGSASGWRRYGDSVRQWRWASEADSRGAWFYGTAPSQLRGKTVTAARIYLPGRERVGSYNAALSAHLYRHPHTTRPAGDVTRAAGPHDVTTRPIGAATGWVSIPAAWGKAIVDGGGGVAIYGAPYLGLAGISTDPRSGMLSLDWTT